MMIMILSTHAKLGRHENIYGIFHHFLSCEWVVSACVRLIQKCELLYNVSSLVWRMMVTMMRRRPALAYNDHGCVCFVVESWHCLKSHQEYEKKTNEPRGGNPKQCLWTSFFFNYIYCIFGQSMNDNNGSPLYNRNFVFFPFTFWTSTIYVTQHTRV